MRSVAVSVPIVLVAADACPELALAVELYVERCRRDRVPVSPAFESAAEEIDKMGTLIIERRRRVVSSVSAQVSSVDASGCEAVECMTVTSAAAILHITPQAVTKRLRAGTLRGDKPGGSWRVDAASVRALQEAAA